jgi:AcrR family transcriptional regulator
MTSPPLATIRPARPTGSRARARQEAIVNAAMELLLEVGYDRLTMDAVAERARASKATIYRHFADKAELVAHAIGGQTPEEMVLSDTGSLRGDLLEFARWAANAAGLDGGLFVATANASRSDAVLAELMGERMSQSKQRALAAIIERAVERSELADASRLPTVCEVCCAVVMQRLSIERAEIDEVFRVHLVDDIALPLLGYTPRRSRGRRDRIGHIDRRSRTTSRPDNNKRDNNKGE